MRLIDLGLATLEQLTDEPSMTTAPSVVVDEPMPSDHVTFAWELNN